MRRAVSRFHMVHLHCRREQERQERLQRALEVEEAEWINQAPQEGSEEEEELGSIPDDIYCPICDKVFKTQNALVNHERYIQTHLS